ncbi:MAG: tRNA threonylcarbamoyladenosine dehydratase [Flammeovirgaceae bacterium]|nr:tRNA threonylcarbamoyladenosine dehydratase [Flammeovirgaceae bacterium]MBE62317.1 tRNA threonylcarbamoyladenosine dehydratase [Flammeovirgaceae bacterium]MBR10878.1 tRNA threonylcarbamoyladenosine dehydratase [Rickettsiales bacterium]|tara:strand:- start:475 stop:1200 length:726 start_codon:yes stop_codon:yes gene_type:complete
MSHWLERTELLIGNKALNRLKSSNILVVGLGGVGSYAAETLVRAGVGSITIIDGDDVDPTNKNRQIQALNSTIGKQKAHVLEERFLDINPTLNITVIDHFMEPDVMNQFLREHHFDFALDCIDSFLPKLSLILTLRRMKCKFISSMGAGGKLDPSRIKIADISNTKECKFAQQLRKMLKNKGVDKKVLCVYSDEIQVKESLRKTDGSNYKKSFYGTISYMPAMFGMTMAAEVIKRLTTSPE